MAQPIFLVWIADTWTHARANYGGSRSCAGHSRCCKLNPFRAETGSCRNEEPYMRRTVALLQAEPLPSGDGQLQERGAYRGLEARAGGREP